MWKRIKQDYQMLKNGRPGHRFRDFQSYKQSHQDSGWAKFGTLSLAIALIVVGLAISWIPGPGGFISIVGVAIIAPYIPGVPPLMDRIEVACRKLYHRLFVKRQA